MNISLSAFAPENLVSRDEFGSPVSRQPAHLRTQAEAGAYLRDFSRVPRRRPFIYLKPPYAIESVPSLLGHANAYRWHSLPRVRRLRASKSQGSSEGVLPWHHHVAVVVVVAVFTLKTVPISAQYLLTFVLVQLTRTPSVVTG